MGEPPIAQYSYQTIQGSECYNDTFKNLISKEPIWIEVKRMLKGEGGHSLDLHPDSIALYAEASGMHLIHFSPTYVSVYAKIHTHIGTWL